MRTLWRSTRPEYEAFLSETSPPAKLLGFGRLGGQALVARVVRTRKERPEVVVRRDLSVLEGESSSWHRRFITMTAVALDDGRSGNLQRQSVLLHHIYAVQESTAQDPAHEMQWASPIFGHLGSKRVASWAPRKERMALEAARKSI